MILRDFRQCVTDLCSSHCSWYATFVRMIVDWLMCTWLLTLPTSSSWHYSGKLYIFLCIINMLLCSISNGYVGSICMMSAPQVKQWSFGTCVSACSSVQHFYKIPCSDCPIWRRSDCSFPDGRPPWPRPWHRGLPLQLLCHAHIVLQYQVLQHPSELF